MNVNCARNVSKLIGISAYLNVNNIQEGFVIDADLANSIKCIIYVINDRKELDDNISKLINPLYILLYHDYNQMFIMIENEKDSSIMKQSKLIIDKYKDTYKIKIIEFPESKTKHSNNIILLQNNYPFNLINCKQFIPIRFLTDNEIKMITFSTSLGQPFTKISLALENILNTIFSCTDFNPPQYISFITGNPVTGPTYTYKRISK
jgi:hypothetical protein